MNNQEDSLRQIAQQLQESWNSADSLAWAELFADDADFINIMGGHFIGKAEIERGHRIIFDTIYKGSTNKFTVQKIRFAGPDVAIVFLLAELQIVTPGMPPMLQARPTLVAQRSGEGWKIVAFQNTLVTVEGSRSALAQRIASALNSEFAKQHPFPGTPPATEK